MNANTRPRGFDPEIRQELMRSFETLEQMRVLPERNLRAIYSSKPLTPPSVRPKPRPTVRQLNGRFANI